MVARIIEYCARNRLAVLLAVAVVFIASIGAIRRVQLDAVPDLGDPQVIVSTQWMGRAPTLIEQQVTYPIVSALVATPRVIDVRGYSMFGMSFVYVIFQEGTDLYWARSRVLEYLTALQERLPEGTTPRLGPDATGIGWGFQYALVDRSGRHGLDELRAFQDYTLRYALEQVAGVAEVASVGGFQKQYQVTVDPGRMRAYDVTLEDVITRVRDANGEAGGNVLEMSGREYFIRGRGYVNDLEAIETTAVKVRGPKGVPVLVRDVATVRLGAAPRRGILEWNGDGEAVGGIVLVRHGENVLDVVGRVKQKVAELRPTLPAGVEVATAYDRSDLIQRAIATLRTALFEEALVVALVIFLFLRHVRSALLPIVSLPVAVAIAFIPMLGLDVPATIMSLGGIAIAIGATVDAEIVMIEASHKRLEAARPGADRQALLAAAAREVTPAIFFSLLIVAVSFLPVFALTGEAGRLFRPLAFTKTFVMLAAAVLSITFAPALRGLLIRGRIRPESRHWLSQAIVRVYRPVVFVALRRPKSTIAMGLLAVLSAIPLALRLGSEFMPPLNEGDVLYMPTTLPNVSLAEARAALQRQDQVFRTFPEVETVFGKAGRAETATDPAPLTMVETTVRLKPASQWRLLPRERWYSSWAPGWLAAVLRRLWPDRTRITWEELTAEMNRAMQFPGWTNAYTMPIKARVDMLSTGVRTPVGVKILGHDLDAIEKVGVALEGVLGAVPGTRSVYYERNGGGLYLDVVPNRRALARYGVTVRDIQRILEAAIGGTSIATTVDGPARFSISVRYPFDARSDVERLKRVLVPVGGGGGSGGMKTGLRVPDRIPELMLAQAMMGEGPLTPAQPPGRIVGGIPGVATDAPLLQWETYPGSAQSPGGQAGSPRPRFVALGDVADIRIVSGPPMVRDEGGLLVGYVYVDIDQGRHDLGGYVDAAKGAVAAAIDSGRLQIPQGHFLKWTGQYEQLEKIRSRMKLVIPATLLIVVVLLFFLFRNLVEVLVVLLSVPFALVGSVWALWLLDYRVSTAVWVGIIALVGLAAQTGIVMIVYIDNAYERRRQAGKIRDLSDIIWAHMEGTVLRVRPKLMTVGTMLAGLLPLLWATGSGADVMKRIAAPMVGGLLTSAFLTLEIIPVVYTYWRQEQLLWERLEALDRERLRSLRAWARVQAAGWALAAAALVAPIYVDLPRGAALASALAGGFAVATATAAYLKIRPAARELVWPAERADRHAA